MMFNAHANNKNGIQCYDKCEERAELIVEKSCCLFISRSLCSFRVQDIHCSILNTDGI